MAGKSKVQGLDKWLSHVDTFSKRAPDINKRIVAEVAFEAKVMLLAEAKRDAPHSLHNWRRGKPAKIGVTFPKVRPFSGPHSAQTILRPGPPGPFTFLEFGGKPHEIRRRRRRRKDGGGMFDGSRDLGLVVQHPGTTGRHTWTAGSAKVKAVQGSLFARAERHAMINCFKG